MLFQISSRTLVTFPQLLDVGRFGALKQAYSPEVGGAATDHFGDMKQINQRNFVVFSAEALQANAQCADVQTSFRAAKQCH